MQAADTVAQAISAALAATDASVASADGDVIGVSSPSAKSGRRIEIRIRDASDFDVAFVVPEAPGSPFEQVISGPSQEASAVVAEVARFVSNLVAERTALLIGPRGRRFVPVSELPSELSRGSTAFSWRGQHDANAPAV
jgi:lipoprotein-anchoring transpeptidase ErfK/SrfK